MIQAEFYVGWVTRSHLLNQILLKMKQFSDIESYLISDILHLFLFRKEEASELLDSKEETADMNVQISN